MDEFLNKLPEYHWAVIDKIRQYNVEKPIKSKTLEALFSLSGARVRNVVRYYRLMGEPIGSSHFGYYLAVSKAEYELTLSHLRERALKELEIVAKGEKINWDKPKYEQVDLNL